MSLISITSQKEPAQMFMLHSADIYTIIPTRPPREGVTIYGTPQEAHHASTLMQRQGEAHRASRKRQGPKAWKDRWSENARLSL